MINALFAVDYYGGMGNNGTLPWPHNAADLGNFKKLTEGQVVVMGRRTWDDPKMPKPLPGRITYVATNRKHVFHTATINGDIKEEILKLEQLHSDKIIWVIGGVDLLEQCEGIFDRLYLTHFKGSYKVDTKLNLKQFLSGWSPVEATAPAGENFTLVVYENLFGRTARST
jgi:dihydrofolate reductase